MDKPWCYHPTHRLAMICAYRRAVKEHRHMYVQKRRKMNPDYPADRWVVRISR